MVPMLLIHDMEWYGMFPYFSTHALAGRLLSSLAEATVTILQSVKLRKQIELEKSEQRD